MHRKIIITGTTCTGKTTLGKKLSVEFGIFHIDLDDIHFLPNWVEKENDEFVKLLEENNIEINSLSWKGFKFFYFSSP